MNVLLQLFLSFFQIGLFSVGGGSAALPLIQEQVVTAHGWLDMTGFGDIVAIAEMTPGPIAVNAASVWDLYILIGIGILTYVFGLTKKAIKRPEGAVMVLLYFAAMAFAIVR